MSDIGRGTRFLAAGTLVAVLAALYLFSGDDRHAAPPRVAIPAPPRTPPPATATAPVAADAATTAAGEPAPAVVDDLCGASMEQRRRRGRESLRDHLIRLTAPAIRRWQAALQDSADPRRRAIGLALSGADPWPVGKVPDDAAPPPPPSKDTPDNNALVLLALESNDPAVYALALRQCRVTYQEMAPGPCQGLSFSQWAAIDPDNALPWIHLAVQAQRGGDSQGADAALAKAAAASRIDGYASTLEWVGLASLPADMSPLERTMASAEFGSVGGLVTPLGVVQLCGSSGPEAESRRQPCTVITNMLADQGSTVIDQAIALALANRLEFPADRRAALDSEHRAIRSALRMTNGSWQDLVDERGLGCKAAAETGRWIDATIAAHGNERAVTRAYQGTAQ